jgi:hypothetical protein
MLAFALPAFGDVAHVGFAYLCRIAQVGQCKYDLVTLARSDISTNDISAK